MSVVIVERKNTVVVKDGQVSVLTIGTQGPEGIQGPVGPMPSAPGSNTQVLFNDGGVFGAHSGLVFDKTTQVLMFPAMTPGGTSGLYAGTRALVRIFQPAVAAGGQAQGENVFVGGGNSTMTNGAVSDAARASSNTGMGWDALLNLTTGAQNTALGHRAGKAITTGMYQVAIGGGALMNNATNIGNVGVGTSALRILTASGGDYNTGIGHDALEFLQTGALNTAVGKRSNWQMTSGSNNVSVGGDSMYSNLTGATNVAIGQAALYGNTSGGSNVAIGASALVANNGSFCVAVGQAALLNLVADNYAVALGTSAGRYLADGATALLSAAQSIFVGGLTKSKQAAQFNEIVIGYGAIGAGTRTAVIGAVDVTDVYLGSATGAAALHCAAITSNGGLQTFGANDSAGPGYRLVRVPNV